MHHRLSMTALAVATLFSSPLYAAEAPDEGRVVVTATRQATRHSELLSDASVVERTDISHASPLDSLGDLLAREAGIETVTTGSPGATANVFIRGANGGHTLLLIDGMRVGSATLGEPGIARIPLAQIERAEVLRGPASGLYGSDAIGGVIQVFTRPTVDGTRLTANASAGSYNTRQVDAGIATRGGLLSASLQVGHLESDGFNAITAPNNRAYNTDLDGYRNTNATATLGAHFNADHELGASVFYSDGENQYDGTYYDANWAAHTDYDFRTRHRIDSVSAFSRNRFSFWTSRVQLGRSTDDSENLDQPGRTSQFKTAQRQISWQNDFNLPYGKALLAAERLTQEIDTSSTYVETERAIDSLLAGWTGSFSGRLRLQANVRHDKNSQFGSKTTGNAGLGLQLTDTWRLRASSGTAFKAPTFNDLYFPDEPFVGGGNPNLKPEKARSTEFGLLREAPGSELAITAHRAVITDLISWQPDDPSDDYSAWHPKNIGQAKLQGITVSGKQRYDAFTLRVKYDFLDHEDSTTGKALLLRARQHGNIGIERQYAATTLGAEVQAVGQRYNDAANNVRLAGYSLVNLRLDHAIDQQLAVFIKLNNVFDRAYQVRDGYATAGQNAFVGVRYSSK